LEKKDKKQMLNPGNIFEKFDIQLSIALVVSCFFFFIFVISVSTDASEFDN
jgi:hypothetical protein